MPEEWKNERPAWCTHEDCRYCLRAQDALCIGHLPEPVAHGPDTNIYRLCIQAGEVFDLQLNDSDLFHFRRLFDALEMEDIKAMRERHEREIEDLQSGCEHEKISGWTPYEWAPGHQHTKVRVCEHCGKILEEKSNAGDPAVTFSSSDDLPCEMYEEGEPGSRLGIVNDCETNGHYLCDNCIHKTTED